MELKMLDAPTKKLVGQAQLHNSNSRPGYTWSEKTFIHSQVTYYIIHVDDYYYLSRLPTAHLPLPSVPLHIYTTIPKYYSFDPRFSGHLPECPLITKMYT